MNFRILDTEIGPVLIYRDTEGEDEQIIVRFYNEETDTIYIQRHGYSFLSKAGIQQIIAKTKPEDVVDSFRKLINFEKPDAEPDARHNQ